MQTWLSAVGILGLSVSITCSSEFFYSQSVIRRSDECNLCFEKDCVTLDKARCDYYAEANSILPKDLDTPGGTEDTAKKKEVDDLMFDLVAKRLFSKMECIPYVSRYTNCNKDNVCLDCKTCACSPEGQWLCTTMQPGHSQHPPLHVDHRVLMMVMQALTDNTHPKKTKRAVTDNPAGVASTITLEKLSEWWYGAKPLHVQNRRDGITTTTDFTLFDEEPAFEIATTVTAPDLEVSGLTIMESMTKTTTNEDADYVAFDEVLRSIAVDSKPYNRRKLLDPDPAVNVNNNQTYSIDYMMIDEDNVTSRANSPFGHVIDFMLDFDVADGVTVAPVTNATEIVIDLLPAVENFDNVNITDNNINYNKDLDTNFFGNTNDILQYNTLNIMKREVTSQKNTTAPKLVPTVTVIVNTTNTTTNTKATTKTEKNPELKENILTPLNKIISEKITELESLQRIKEDLQKFIIISIHPNYTPKEKNTTNFTNFSIYNIAMATGLDVDLRRSSPNSIGSKWQQVSALLIRSSPIDSVHSMKLLQCTLTLDISKLQDAIGLIEFAHSRRMATLIDKVNDDTIDKIDLGLGEIHNKILMLIKYYKRKIPKPIKRERARVQENATKDLPTTTMKSKAETHKEKKRSFINHIRTLLKTSKDDIADLLHKKVSKSEIVKELAKKRLDEISQKRYNEYEDTMKRWQQNLELTSRLKRSVLDQLKARSLKNIIPRYLRHKVNPRIKENERNATADATRKADARKKKRKEKKASRRGHKTRMTKTSKSRKSATSKIKKVTRLPSNNSTTKATH
ncbi:hypothetical protein PYW07_009803 [Mythimna separata]|uniref:Uncharacterized protein n=1 Tax=Mythimna separata TaxID=271217 RepID=A0AAD8DNP5_MYTSE|nr:hypothetical protein PYW07_009803 [Mythimna separata]